MEEEKLTGGFISMPMSSQTATSTLPSSVLVITPSPFKSYTQKVLESEWKLGVMITFHVKVITLSPFKLYTRKVLESESDHPVPIQVVHAESP